MKKRQEFYGESTRVIHRKNAQRYVNIKTEVCALRAFSHSRPITRRSAPPSPNREGSRCGGSAAYYIASQHFAFQRPITRRSAPLTTVHRKVVSDKEGLQCGGSATLR